MDFKNIEKEILENFRSNISISNFRKEYDMNSSYTKKRVNFFGKVACLLLSIVILGGGIILANVSIKNINKGEKVYALGSMKEAEDSGYIENIDMSYIYSNNIGIKVDSIILSDNNVDVILNLDFSKNPLQRNSTLINYIIYDENNNIYAYSDYSIYNRGKNLKDFYNTMDISYEKNNLYNNIYSKNHSQNNLEETPNSLISQLTLYSDKKFPKSQIMYIKIFDIGYIENNKFKTISNNSEWTIEINIPDKFYNRESYEYSFKENINGVNLYEMYVSDTSTTVIMDVNDFDDSMNNVIKIVDENGKEYSSGILTYKNGNKITMFFPISKNQLSEKIYMIFSINGKNEKVELIRK